MGQVESRGGSYPGDLRLLPPSTQRYADDVSGYWAVYWHVAQLEPLPSDDWIDVADLRNFKTDKRYGRPFVPEGPITSETRSRLSGSVRSSLSTSRYPNVKRRLSDLTRSAISHGLQRVCLPRCLGP